MVVLIDNYDSFTYNIVQYLQCLHQDVRVFTNDQIDIETLQSLNPNHIVISPGPNAPDQAGISLDVILAFHKTTPILGICLGHQCIGQLFGANIIQAPEIVHGKTSTIHHNKKQLFKSIENPFQGMRYHSLMIEKDTLSPEFSIDATANEIIMAISHRKYPLFGLQFHPESILSEHGFTLLANFLNYEHN